MQNGTIAGYQVFQIFIPLILEKIYVNKKMIYIKNTLIGIIMSNLYKLKQNKSFNDVDNVILTTNFMKMVQEFQKVKQKYPLSIHYMTKKIHTKKERLERVKNFLSR